MKSKVLTSLVVSAVAIGGLAVTAPAANAAAKKTYITCAEKTPAGAYYIHYTIKGKKCINGVIVGTLTTSESAVSAGKGKDKRTVALIMQDVNEKKGDERGVGAYVVKHRSEVDTKTAKNGDEKEDSGSFVVDSDYTTSVKYYVTSPGHNLAEGTIKLG